MRRKPLLILSGSVLLAAAWSPAIAADLAQADPTAASAPAPVTEDITVIGKKRDDARNGIQTQIGASTYTIDEQALETQPGGTSNPLNQVLLQGRA